METPECLTSFPKRRMFSPKIRPKRTSSTATWRPSPTGSDCVGLNRATETLCHRYGRPSKHALATNELVTLGYALWRLAKADLNGTRHQVNQLKIGSDGECAGKDIALTSAAFKQAILAGQVSGHGIQIEANVSIARRAPGHVGLSMRIKTSR
ncbi:hypothetical protein ABIF38_008916 [Bradyrhizobium japonicum]|jgi:hypothetical protein|uniref:Uncharacterized protein n=1 Tax=Bradyrhizobium elkanii TaxID=29448 RepID=A0ABV4EUY7_BRAEL